MSGDPFGGVLSRGAAAEAASGTAWLQAMLDAEAALARALAHAGLITAEDAERIAAACRAERFDADAIGAEAAASGNPAVPLVRALTQAVGPPADAHVHRGATSQDVIDTALMLVARRALAPLIEDLEATRAAAQRLAAEHRDSVMLGRTLLQPAVPVTFALKAAGWAAGLADARGGLERVRDARLAAQLGGAAGTLASLGDAGPAVLSHYARELGLAEPDLPWHTLRARPAELAAALAIAAGAAGKIARDVVLLAQAEVAEVREAAGGGSSTMPHKRNPVAAIATLACAEQAPGLAATVLAAMISEHERAAGAWHSEWRPLTALLQATGSAASWLRACLEGLEVDTARMRANLDALGGLPLAERVAAALAAQLGRLPAHELVEQAAAEAGRSGRAFADVLAERTGLGAERIAELLDPAGYLGSATVFVDRVLNPTPPARSRRSAAASPPPARS